MPAKIPHDRLGTTPIHVTYRLLGSLPKSVTKSLSEERERKLAMLAAEILNLPAPSKERMRAHRNTLISAEYEQALEEALHGNPNGPYDLQQPKIAQIVIDSWLNLQERSLAYVYAICVMSNHVHLVIQAPTGEEQELGSLMKRHKGFTARMANRILGRTGQGFWERIYFDRRIRRGKFFQVIWYVLNNPVKAGLVSRWQDWPHTYLHPEYESLFIET